MGPRPDLAQATQVAAATGQPLLQNPGPIPGANVGQTNYPVMYTQQGGPLGHAMPPQMFSVSWQSILFIKLCMHAEI